LRSLSDRPHGAPVSKNRGVSQGECYDESDIVVVLGFAVAASIFVELSVYGSCRWRHS